MPFFTRRGSKFSRIWHCVASFTIISFQTLTCLDHGCAISFSFTAWSSLWCSKLTFELRSLKALADVLWCQWCKACCWVGCRELDADVQDKFVMSFVNQGRWECWHTKPWCVRCEQLNSNSRMGFQFSWVKLTVNSVVRLSGTVCTPCQSRFQLCLPRVPLKLLAACSVTCKTSLHQVGWIKIDLPLCIVGKPEASFLESVKEWNSSSSAIEGLLVLCI